MQLDPSLAREAKALVVLAFRNGPLEDLHAGELCPACAGRREVSHISEAEMKRMMKRAVDSLYRLLWQRDHDPDAYRHAVAFGARQTVTWDDPEILDPFERTQLSP